MSNRPIRAFALALIAVAAAGCEQKSAPPPPAKPAALAPVDRTAPETPSGNTPVAVVAPVAPPVPTMPALDVGKLDTVKVVADGFGATASDAVGEAIRLAILQVNGAAMESTTLSARLGVDVVAGQSAASLRAEGFADAVRTRSGGVVQNFRIVGMSEPGAQGTYKATIEANIARFVAPAELKKVKLVVAPLRFDRASIPIGDRMVPAREVGIELRQRIQDALVGTGRFAVLDRGFSPEVEQELDMIASGQSPMAEITKLSQAVPADLIWTGRINGLAYNRHAQQLRISDRQLVSYSGGWSVSQKIVNVATRQVMTSETLRGTAPPVAPTTLGRGVNSDRILGGMADDLVNGVVASILQRTFPVTVVALQGADVVLSQGGLALKPGMRYAMVTMGAEIKDPQTGQSLGRTEAPCCELVVDRVTPNLSYGHLEGAAPPSGIAPSALQVREQLHGGPTAVAAGSAAPPVAGTRPAARRGNGSPRTEDFAAPPPPDKKNDDKW
ncbi:MAG: CsgG/HfaB family protein [Caldimonas sp.]